MSDGTGDTMPHAPAQIDGAGPGAEASGVGGRETPGTAEGAVAYPDLDEMLSRLAYLDAADWRVDGTLTVIVRVARVLGDLPALLSELAAARADNERLRGDVHRTFAALIAARAELADLQHGMATYVRDRIGPVCAERDRALAELARYEGGTWVDEVGVAMADGVDWCPNPDECTAPHDRRRRSWRMPVEPVTAEETPDHA